MAPLDMADVAGAVLIGGASRRMGRPKSGIRVQANGPTMLESVVACVRECCGEVMLVGSTKSEVTRELGHVRRVEDVGQGPVGGLLAALGATNRARLFLTGCDMPFLSPHVVSRMIERSLETGGGVVPVVAGSDGREVLQPLHAVFHHNQLAGIERAFNDGMRSLVEIVERLEIERMQIDASTMDASGMWSFFNVNTPADFEVARRHASRGRMGGQALY